MLDVDEDDGDDDEDNDDDDEDGGDDELWTTFSFDKIWEPLHLTKKNCGYVQYNELLCNANLIFFDIIFV